MGRFLGVATFCVLLLTSVAAAKDKDTPAAAATRKKLKSDVKISLEFKETRLDDAVKELSGKVREAQGSELSIVLDNKGGVSNNMTVSYSAKEQTLANILDGLLKKYDLGYIVISKEYPGYKGGRYDGWLLIVKGKARGYPIEEDSPKKEEKSAKSKPKAEKPPAKDKADDSDKSAEDPEERAAHKLKLAKDLADQGKVEKAKQRYKDIIKDYPKTKAAEEAKKLLENLDK